MQSHGWSLLFHDCLVEQLQKLKVASDRAEATDPSGFSANANVKLYRAQSTVQLDVGIGRKTGWISRFSPIRGDLQFLKLLNQTVMKEQRPTMALHYRTTSPTISSSRA